MKWIFLLALIVGSVVFSQDIIDYFKPVQSQKSHHGAAALFMEAALSQNVAAMESHCRGIAVGQCQPTLSTVLSQNPTFAKYVIETGGSPGAGSRTSGRALCYGQGGDMFMVLAFTLEKQDDLWKISEMGTERIGR